MSELLQPEEVREMADCHERWCATTGEIPFPCDCRAGRLCRDYLTLWKMYENHTGVAE